MADETQIDYTGAVYGSLLAASVVAGTSPGQNPPSGLVTGVLLLATGLVFWIAHVYSGLVGERRHRTRLSWAQARTVGARERPLLQAALPPAVAAVTAWALGLSGSTSAWLALATALTAQVAWAALAAVKARESTGIVVVAAVGNLVIGLILVLLKVLLTH
ncbi:hypothetical protein [Spongiactinospora sp. TRM90649]|uniref:hypothetical protein n=1 Tax=Spongiactinospora sp. TRM90649 TaxID=3031114 RepID=UPI0023F63010|nr:hypothetical protein [Spongiactinospora sp. TRM90649]MDF5752166.1 hypothetical protein [Spongiactinospora sp. TRM90649]